MRTHNHLFILLTFLTVLTACNSQKSAETEATSVILKGVTLIDGSGSEPKENVNIMVEGDSIAQILPGIANAGFSSNAQVIDMEGKIIMPMLVNAHGHLGLLKGDAISPENYTRDNIIRQLKQYQDFGIGAILSLGSDREIIFDLRDSSQQEQLPGAMILTAGYGFGTKDGVPPVNSGFDKVLRPETAEEATQDMRELAKLQPDFVKVWVDDGLGTMPKIQPEIYQAIIEEAHRQGIAVAAHVYYLDDAKNLAKDGIDIIAHSIRDQEVDTELLELMKANNITYIPTLSLDDYNFVYTKSPDWLNSSFFKASLEPGVYDRLTSEDYLKKTQSDPKLEEKMAAFKTASRNLKKIYDAGIRVALGTDSGAQPIRAQGFSEHLELQLMHEAGIPPLMVLKIATQNAAQTLGIDKTFGVLQAGKKANFIVLDSDPSKDIKNTRTIDEVWRNGEVVSQGPTQ